MIYLTSTNQSAIIAAEAQISDNCDIPNNVGTARWWPIEKAINVDLWFILKPPVEGWGNATHFTQEQILSGVDMTDIIEQERNSAWFPPSPVMGDA